MRMSEPANKKYKKVHDDFPNLAILTKSAMLDEEPLTFENVSFRKNSLGESVAAFSLEGSLDSPFIVLIDIDIIFTMDGVKFCLPIAEVLLLAAKGDLVRFKKQWYWNR